MKGEKLGLPATEWRNSGADLPRRSCCMGWSTPECTAAGHTSESLKDTLWSGWPGEKKTTIRCIVLVLQIDIRVSWKHSQNHSKTWGESLISSPIGWLDGTGCDQASGACWVSTRRCWRWGCGCWICSKPSHSRRAVRPHSRGCSSRLHKKKRIRIIMYYYTSTARLTAAKRNRRCIQVHVVFALYCNSDIKYFSV